MHHRLIASLAIVCLALGAGGCRSTEANRKSRDRKYEEVLMPRQTGSYLQRRILIPVDRDTQPKKKKKPAAPKPEAGPSATPSPEEESTPQPDRFR
jgi:hypothetical protein